MQSPKITGISNITGKTVVVRHATGADMVNVEEYLRKYRRTFDLAKAEVVVAVEDDSVIGFGILETRGDSGCLSIVEERKRRGIGSSIVKHIMESSPVKNVYVDVCPDEPTFAERGYAVGE